MTITLGGITLSDHLVLLGIEEAPARAMSSQRTLGGRMVVAVGPSLTDGRSLSLQSENHLTLAQITSIKALEASGQTVTLSHPRGTFSVIVTGTPDVKPDIQLVNPASSTTQWWSGTITMIEV